MKFVLDRMLGKLTKWLRVLGYDAVYQSDLSEKEVLDYVREGRIVLTRGNRLKRLRTDAIVWVHFDRVEDQLKELCSTGIIELSRRDRFSRCIRCNERLIKSNREEAREFVPEYIYHAHNSFSRCPSCNRFYWSGTHLRRMATYVESRVLRREECKG